MSERCKISRGEEKLNKQILQRLSGLSSQPYAHNGDSKLTHDLSSFLSSVFLCLASPENNMSLAK